MAALLTGTWSLIRSTVHAGSFVNTSTPSLTEDFLPFFSIDRLAPDVDVESAEEEQRRTGGATETLGNGVDASTATDQPPLSNSPTTASSNAPVKAVDEDEAGESWEDEADEAKAEVSRPSAVVVKTAKATSTAGQWDDEDAEEEVEEALEDWEAMAEEDEMAEKARRNKEKKKGRTSSSPLRGDAASTSSSSALLPPVAAVHLPLLDLLCEPVNSALSRAHSLREEEPPTLPPSLPPSSRIRHPHAWEKRSRKKETSSKTSPHTTSTHHLPTLHSVLPSFLPSFLPLLMCSVCPSLSVCVPLCVLLCVGRRCVNISVRSTL